MAISEKIRGEKISENIRIIINKEWQSRKDLVSIKRINPEIANELKRIKEQEQNVNRNEMLCNGCKKHFTKC